MKYPILIIALLFASCESTPPKDPTLAKIEAELVKQLDDSDSYEFVSLADLDTLTSGEFAAKEAELLRLRHSNRDRIIQKAESEVAAGKKLVTYGKEYQADLDRANQQMEQVVNTYAAVDSLLAVYEQAKDDKGIKHIKTALSFRSVNANGAKELQQVRVRMNGDGEVILIQEM